MEPGGGRSAVRTKKVEGATSSSTQSRHARAPFCRQAPIPPPRPAIACTAPPPPPLGQLSFARHKREPCRRQSRRPDSRRAPFPPNSLVKQQARHRADGLLAAQAGVERVRGGLDRGGAEKNDGMRVEMCFLLSDAPPRPRHAPRHAASKGKHMYSARAWQPRAAEAHQTRHQPTPATHRTATARRTGATAASGRRAGAATGRAGRRAARESMVDVCGGVSREGEKREE